MSCQINGIDVKIGQVWESESGYYSGTILGFNSKGVPVIETSAEGVCLLLNTSWRLVKQKKVLKYKVFKDIASGKVFTAEPDYLDCVRLREAYKELSPILEYEYEDE